MGLKDILKKLKKKILDYASDPCTEDTSFEYEYQPKRIDNPFKKQEGEVILEGCEE